jgi:hypothetical protein
MKAYLKYDLLTSFGVVASNADVLLLIGGKLVLTAALESISIWNLRQGTLVGLRIVDAHKLSGCGTLRKLGKPFVWLLQVPMS